MSRSPAIALSICVTTTVALAQTPAAPPHLRAVNRTAYMRTTDLFAEWRPFVKEECGL